MFFPSFSMFVSIELSTMSKKAKERERERDYNSGSLEDKTKLGLGLPCWKVYARMHRWVSRLSVSSVISYHRLIAGKHSAWTRPRWPKIITDIRQCRLMLCQLCVHRLNLSLKAQFAYKVNVHTYVHCQFRSEPHRWFPSPLSLSLSLSLSHTHSQIELEGRNGEFAFSRHAHHFGERVSCGQHRPTATKWN